MSLIRFFLLVFWTIVGTSLAATFFMGATILKGADALIFVSGIVVVAYAGIFITKRFWDN